MKMKNKVSIYVPSTINVSEKIDSAAQVNNTCVFLSGLFGGCTSVNTSGCWIDSKNKLVKEEITIVYSFCDNIQFLRNRKKVIAYCKKLCDEMSQECISLEINNKLYFIN